MGGARASNVSQAKTSWAAAACWLLAAILGLPLARSLGGDVLLEGFEKAGTFKTSGKAAVVQVADAVTEGAKALSLAPGAGVSVTIPPSAVRQPGWLKIDTFEPQPVVAALELELPKMGRLRGYVQPGKDVLAVPVSLAARAHRGPWPNTKVTLSLKNLGGHDIVVDNIRLTDPAPPPPGSVLLDFGPDDQVLWPGFEPGGDSRARVIWEEGKTYSYRTPCPDPLQGDFSGCRLTYRASRKLKINTGSEPATARLWLTHYSYHYSPPVEYMAKLNDRALLGPRRLTKGQMLSPAGLFQGKGEPWTTDWLSRTFTPRLVSRLECPLKPKENTLELGNCQVAALAVISRRGRQAAAAFFRQLEAELKRYRRQFVLATQDLPRCEVGPTEAEAKAGMIVFHPPADEWFYRQYVPRPEHRAGKIELKVAAGSLGSAAVAVSPGNDAARLEASAGALLSPVMGRLPAGSCRIHALQTMPVVSGGCVYRQPFVVASGLRSVRARGVYWFLLQVRPPKRISPGRYAGAVRLTLGRASTAVPIEVEVVRIPSVKTRSPPTFSILSTVDCREVYWSLKDALPEPVQFQATRGVLAAAASAGLNASMIRGPSYYSGSAKAIQWDGLECGLRERLHLAGAGRKLLNLRGGAGYLRGAEPGTKQYQDRVADLVRGVREKTAKHKLDDYALYCGYFGSGRTQEMVKLAAAVRKAGGKPAVETFPEVLKAMGKPDRDAFFRDVDTLIFHASGELPGVANDFKKTAWNRTVLLWTESADEYTWGFYAWAAGADGAILVRPFSTCPPFNAFCFDGQSLLLPTPTLGRFEPTLAALRLQQGIADYRLARQCQALVELAGQRKEDAGGLQDALKSIRSACATKPPRFDRRRLRSVSVSPATLREMRDRLVTEAQKVSAGLAKPPSPTAPSPRP